VPTRTTAPAKDKPAGKLPLRTDRKPLPKMDDGSGGGLGRMLAYTLVVLLLGAAAVFAARRYLPRRTAASGARILVVDGAFLGPRKQLHIVEVGRQRFLVASCRDSVSVIAELAGPFCEVYEREKARAEDQPPDEPARGDRA
jgi:flagellar biogenesis protein FliO